MTRRGALVVAGVAVAVVLLVVVAGGPIGDDAASPGGGDGGGATTTSAAPTTTRPIAPADRPFCDAFGALLAGPLADPATDPSDPASLGLAAVATLGVLEEMERTAPDELAAPVATVAGEYRAALAVFERYGYDLERVAAEATAEEQQVLDDFGATGSDADDALVPIEAWVADRCSTEDLPDLDD